MRIRLTAFGLVLLLILLSCGCSKNETKIGETAPSADLADLSEMDFSLSNLDRDPSYDDSDVRVGKASDGITTITAAGTYEFEGNACRGIVVSAGEQDKVQIVLKGAEIRSENGPAIVVESGDKVFITAEAGTENTLSDGASYDLTLDGSTVDGAVFSKSDLTLNGEGTLLIEGNYKHGVVSKDDLVIVSVDLSVSAASAALCGKDCVKLSECTVRATAGSDAIRSDNAEDSSRGFIFGENCRLSLAAGNDGIQAETAVKLENVTGEIETGAGGTSSLSSSSESYKGIKAGSDIMIAGGTWNLNTQDDAVHSNHTVHIASGEITIASGDDGIHADTDLSVSGGKIKVTQSYEALEATEILISGGVLTLRASDDGLNAAGGADGSSFGDRPGMGHFSGSAGQIVISGGRILVEAAGDGIDANGSITFSGGITLVAGPTNNGNGSFDYDTTAAITGGIVVALGSSGMAQGFSDTEGQGALFVSFDAQSAETNLSLCDSSGNALLSFTPSKAYSSAVISCPALQIGKSVSLVAGGKPGGLDDMGFGENVSLSGGETVSQITLTTLLYSEGGFGGMGGMGGGRPGGMGGMDRPGDMGGMDRPGGMGRPDFRP